MRSKVIINSLAVSILVLSCAISASAQQKDPNELVKEGDRLYREHKYEEAARIYEEAYILIKTVAPKPLEDAPYREEAKKSAKRLKSHKKKLEELKAQREEKRREVAEAKRLKEEYIRVLKMRRDEEILLRRAERKTLSLALKKEAAKRWQAVKEEGKKYKFDRANKRAVAEAQEKELRLAQERMAQEEKELSAMAKRLTPPEKKPEVVKELKMVKEYGAEKEPYKIKVAKAKEAAQEAAVAQAEETQAEAGAGELAKRESAAKAEEIKLAKEAERQERFRQKAAVIRQRISRIEEAMFKKRQEKEEKRREELKYEAIKKAGRTKIEFDNYSLRPGADQKVLDRAQRHIDKADTYFNKEMYKEAGELYDRAVLTLQGKLH